MFRNDNQQTKDPIKQIESAIQDVPEQHISPTNAQRYAIQFNKLKAIAASQVERLKEQLGDVKVTSRVLKKKAYTESTAKTVEEKRLDRDCDETYLESVKQQEKIEASIEYLHTLVEVCGDYHIYFRQIGGS